MVISIFLFNIFIQYFYSIFLLLFHKSNILNFTHKKCHAVQFIKITVVIAIIIPIAIIMTIMIIIIKITVVINIIIIIPIIIVLKTNHEIK